MQGPIEKINKTDRILAKLAVGIVFLIGQYETVSTVGRKRSGPEAGRTNAESKFIVTSK